MINFFLIQYAYSNIKTRIQILDFFTHTRVQIAEYDRSTFGYNVWIRIYVCTNVVEK